MSQLINLIIWIRIRVISWIFCIQWGTVVASLQSASFNASNAGCCTRACRGGALLLTVTYDKLEHISWSWLACDPCVCQLVIFHVPPLTSWWRYCRHRFIPMAPDCCHIVCTPAVLLEWVLWWWKSPWFAPKLPTLGTADVVAQSVH